MLSICVYMHLLFFYCSGDHRDLHVLTHSFPTLRSSDRPSITTTVFVRWLYSRFADQELRKRLIFEMDADPYAGDADHASFRSDDGEINVERDLKDRFEVQHVKTVSAGAKTEPGPWTLRYEGASAFADAQAHGSHDPNTLSNKFEEPGELGGTFVVDTAGRP